MKKIVNKIGQVLQVVLMAPVKLPGKAANILKYITVGLGILEKVLEEKNPPSEVSPSDSEPETIKRQQSADKNSSSGNDIEVTTRKERFDEME